MNVGVVGLGHLGKIHLKILSELPNIKITAVYDIIDDVTLESASKYETKACKNYQELLSFCDTVFIITPTPTHFDLASEAIKLGKHVFIEKPATDKVEDTKKLIDLANEFGVLVQVGHVERFNPAFIAAKEYIQNPILFEIQRLTSYNKRGNDVSVVFDLMIHDIDLVLNIVNSKIKHISATGTKLVSESADLVSAHIEFENGCLVNLTSNRVAIQNVRTMKIFEQNGDTIIDLLNKTTTVNRIESNQQPTQSDNNHQSHNIYQIYPTIKPTNAIKTEIECFYNSIIHKTPVIVSLYDAKAALEVAQEIEFQLNKNS